MDKRSIIFVISLTLTLWAFNWYTQSSKVDETKTYLENKKLSDAKKASDLELITQEKTAKPHDLPLATYYSNSDKTESLGKGLLFNGQLFTKGTGNKLPETVYSNEALFEIQPQIHPLIAHYKSKEAGELVIGRIPHFGTWDLQLVTLDDDPQIYFSEVKEGKLIIPSEEISQLRQEPIKHIPNSLALQKVNETWRPVALYIKDSHSLLPLDQLEQLQKKVAKETFSETTLGEERFYVIENETVQLVFSTVGGALAEINLPLRSEENRQSVVKEIEFGRIIDEESPRNAHFPGHPFVTAEAPNEVKEGKLGGYYPLLRRDILLPGQTKVHHVLPKYYAFNIVSEYPELAELNYRVKNFTKNSITFEARQQNRTIVKTFTLDEKAPYLVNLTLKVDGDARGLWLTSGIPEVEWISNGPAPALKYRITKSGQGEVNTIGLVESTLDTTVRPDWLCNSNGFLGMIMDPLTEIDQGIRSQQISGTVVPSRLVLIDPHFQRFEASKMPGYLLMLPLKAQGGTMEFRLFTGPFATDILKEIDALFTNPETGYNPDYIASQTVHGYFTFISGPFSKLLFFLMRFFHSLTHSWGISIILLTVALRIMLYPLNAWSAKSTAKMSKIQPMVQKIQEKYKKDPKKAQLEIMNLYREQGVNPISGCFPLLIQLPFLIGMFDLLKSTFELRGASFIPGWINDLSQPDVLFSWDYPIPYIGTQFHLLPILLGIVMFLQQKMMQQGPKDPNEMTEQQRQQRAMGTVMGFIFPVMFYHFPSGLNIYWMSSTLLGFLQQWWTNKKIKGL